MQLRKQTNDGYFSDFDHRPLVFLRFNPDAYLDLLGIKHTSCFIQNKSGIMVLKRQHWVIGMKE
jgi:hypothetical protein